MTSPLVPGPVADRVLRALGAGFVSRAGALVVPIVDGLTEQTQLVETLLDHGFDLDRTPAPGWLGGIAGTDVPAGLDLPAQRALVRDRPAARRGSPGALLAAALPHLRGGQRITLIERDGGNAYQLRVQVYESEVIDETALAAALQAQKPVGLVLTLELLSGASYAHMTTVHGPTYADERDEFPTFDDASQHLPE